MFRVLRIYKLTFSEGSEREFFSLTPFQAYPILFHPKEILKFFITYEATCSLLSKE